VTARGARNIAAQRSQRRLICILGAVGWAGSCVCFLCIAVFRHHFRCMILSSG
jgi:hypothetical protein